MGFVAVTNVNTCWRRKNKNTVFVSNNDSASSTVTSTYYNLNEVQNPGVLLNNLKDSIGIWIIFGSIRAPCSDLFWMFAVLSQPIPTQTPSRTFQGFSASTSPGCATYRDFLFHASGCCTASHAQTHCDSQTQSNISTYRTMPNVNTFQVWSISYHPWQRRDAHNINERLDMKSSALSMLHCFTFSSPCPQFPQTRSISASS